MNALLRALGRVVSRRRWWTIGAWVLALSGVLVASGLWRGDFVTDYSVPGSESSRGLDVLRREFPSASGYSGQIVFHAEKGTVADRSAAVASTMRNVASLPDVTTASDPLTTPGTPAVSRDGTIAYGTVSWSVVPASLDTDYLAALDRAVRPARSAGLTVEYGAGAGQIGQEPDDTTSEIIGLTAALLLLLLMFGSLVAALVPLVGAVFSVAAGLALVGLLAAVTDLPTTSVTVATLLGLGVAIDYGLFLVARHREQIDHGMPVDESVAATNATSGAAVLVAGSTVVLAILGLYVASIPFIGALGAAAAVVVAVTVVSALTLVPAFLAVARGRVRSRRSRRRPDAPGAPGAPEHSASARWGRMVSGRPWPWCLASVALLLLLAVPVLSMRLGQVDAGADPTSQSSRRAYDLVSRGFGPGANGPITVVLELPAGSTQSSAQVLESARSSLSATEGVASVSEPSTNKPGTVAVLTVVPTTAPDAAATTALVDRLRDTVLPGLDVTRTYLVGSTAANVDFTERTSDRMLWLILAVVGLSLVLLTVAFRSLTISVKAAALNLLSVGAAYGVVVAAFSWGWGSGLIGIDQNLPIPAYVPMLMFAIVFGLSMDYEVFLLSRVREAWLQTRDGHRSVAIGIGSTARVITTAAAIMIAVFASFVLSNDPAVKMLAVGMAAAVLIDASVVRMMLVPSLMALLGARAWWLPRPLSRVIPDLRLEGPLEPPAEAVSPPVPAQRAPASTPDREARPGRRGRRGR